MHAEGKPLAEGVDLDVIARRTPGFTGADLANLMNEAALLAARRDLKLIGTHQLEEAIDRVMAGPERKSRLISDAEKRVIAYHEGGHALGRPRAAPRRPDPQDLDHPEGSGPGLHAHAADGGQVPRHPQRARATSWRCCSAGARPRS